MSAIKKLMLLAIAASVVAAFAAPAAMGAQWTVNGEPLPEYEEVEITMEGLITEEHYGYKGYYSNISIGPCAVQLTGRLWNENGEALGEVDEFGAPEAYLNELELASPECNVHHTGIESSGCDVSVLENTNEHSYIRADTGKNEVQVTIGDLYMYHRFFNPCVWEQATAGNLIGSWDFENNSVEFNESTGMINAGFYENAYGLRVSGNLQLTSASSEGLSLEP